MTLEERAMREYGVPLSSLTPDCQESLRKDQIRDAAPKLLAALEQILDSIVGEQRDPEEITNALGIHASAAIAQADAAIKEAGGQ